jgi:HPt (histidine-containing phosphotransfer) domain-containing protein
MPEMDGIEATRRIRFTPGIHQPRIIAMTASAFAEDREECLAAGMNGYVTKPVRREDLVAALESTPDGSPREAGATPAGDSTPGARPPVVDPTVLTALLGSLGLRAAAAEGRLIDTFLRELPGLVSQLRDGIDGDRELVHRAAHTLKSSSANMGARRLSELCAELEDRTRDGIPGDAARSVSTIGTEVDEVHRALAARRRQLPR